MSGFDRELIINIIRGAFSCFNAAHPELAIPEERWGRVAVRAGGMIVYEHRLRCGVTSDRHLLERLVRLLQRICGMNGGEAA